MSPYARRRSRPRPTFRPRLEALEGRTLPSTFTLLVNPAVDNAGAVAELKADIAAANADGQANTLNLFAGGVYTLTAVDNYLYGPDGLPPVASTLTINGQGATIQRSTASGMPAFRLFYVSGGFSGVSAGDLALEDLTLRGGLAEGGNGAGGGLGAGGAIFNQGTVTLLGVTLTGNTAQGGNGVGIGGGGGIGQDALADGSGGGFGGPFAGAGGKGALGGGGFRPGDDAVGAQGGGRGGLGSSGDGGTGFNGGGGAPAGGSGGNFGFGGGPGFGGGGGGVGGGGGAASGTINGGTTSGPGGGGGFGAGGGGGGVTGGAGFGGGGGGGFGGPISGFGGGHGGNGGVGGPGGGGGAGLGGAVFSMFGSVTLVNSTLAGNFALGGAGGAEGGGGFGGAVFNLDGALTILDATVAANTVGSGAGGSAGGSVGAQMFSDGGGVYNLAFGNTLAGGPAVAALTLANSILADDTGGTDLASTAVTNGLGDTDTVTATGPNLVGFTIATISGPAPLTGDPQLGPLQFNGGLSPTMALQPGSPAIDAGSNAAVPAGLTTDQRGPGFSRILGPAVDLGAFETGNIFQNGNPFAGLTPQEHFVQALYLDALGRTGSKAELDSWAVQFNQGLSQTDAQASIARGIDQSTEGRDHLVKGWYETYLGRPAVGGEELGWVGLLWQGQSEEQVLSQILASPEFYNRAQTLGDFGSADQNYVQALYRVLLGRTASDAEATSWVVTLPQQGRQGVALGFLISMEYRTDLVQSYYGVLLHRSPDPQGLAFWVGIGEDSLDTRIGFEASPEFFTNG